MGRGLSLLHDRGSVRGRVFVHVPSLLELPLHNALQEYVVDVMVFLWQLMEMIFRLGVSDLHLSSLSDWVVSQSWNFAVEILIELLVLLRSSQLSLAWLVYKVPFV